MAPKNNRSAARCHSMTTRSKSSSQEGSGSSDNSSTESSFAYSSPEISPARTCDLLGNPNSKRRRSSVSESEGTGDSPSNRRPMKKLKLTEIRTPVCIDSDDDTDEPRTPSEPKEELGGSDAAFETPSPTLHVRSDGYWPTIRDDFLNSLQDPSIRIDIPCIICGDECIVVRQEHWGLRRPGGIGGELPVILCCGHMIGDECLVKWKTTRRDEHEPLSCPICRMTLECSDCDRSMPGWPLTLEIPVGETRTIQQGGHRVARCNACEAECIVGDRMRVDNHGPENYPGHSQTLLDWFKAMRSRAAAEVWTGRHGNVASRDVAELILDNTFEAMGQAVDKLEDAVRDNLRETQDRTEGELVLCLPWNQPGSPVAEDDYESSSSDVTMDFWI